MNIVGYRYGPVAIVLAGLMAGCVTSFGYPRAFSLQFPDDVDLGELWLFEDVNCFTCGNGEKSLGRAKGRHDVRLPAEHWFVSLKMPKNASRLLPHLSHPTLASIGDLRLKGSDVVDGDLKYLQGMNLRSIDLSDTKISGSGLRYLKPNQKWTFVNLTGCDGLRPEYLSHFRGWRRATISVVGYKWSGGKYSEAELQLLATARRIICDGRPENLCGTQIR
jgi:hypothetical protein